MQKNNFLILVIVLAFNFGGFAQKSEINTNSFLDYQNAVDLYNNKQYQGAIIAFQKVKSPLNSAIQANCAYYIATCSLWLDTLDADQNIQDFVDNYPTSSKQNLAFINVGIYNFEHGKYTKALTWLEKADQNTLTIDEIDKYKFYKAYSYFNLDKKKDAQIYFNQVANSPEYGQKAKYYLGFLAYDANNYTEASKYFEQVSGQEKYQEKYQEKLGYYQADMSFKTGKFENAILQAKQALNKITGTELSELNKIIGESYFNLKQYDQAIPYLKQYKGKNGKWNNTDFYQLGYAYYKQKDFENAISQFSKIIAGNDYIAQNAYYHLGESYLNTNKKQQALNAFKNASEMIFDLKIQEDAFLNYARLSYDIGNSYQSVPDVLNAFLLKYPQQINKTEIENLLINSYITSKNYKQALLILEKNKANTNLPIYQKLLFYRALELFTDGNYTDALPLLDKAVVLQKEPLVTARATFWRAETQYVLQNYNNALQDFKQFLLLPNAAQTIEIKNSNYHLAYTYFKLKQYDMAANYFEKYTQTNKDDKPKLADAYLRLADSRFVTTKYTQAQEAYDQVITTNSIDADYAAFQKAICYGFMAKNDKKITQLQQFIKNYSLSNYRDDALFELANTYTTINQPTQAIATYDQLIKDFANGNYTAKSILRQGLIYYNNDNDQQALLKFKKVATDYPRTDEALEAVKTARLLYVDNGKVQEYATWVKSLDYLEITDTELDNDSWESAQKQYQQGNTKQAIITLKEYISNFAKGMQIVKANFYLAESYYNDKAIANAIPYYEFVITQARNEYTEQSLSRLSEIWIKKDNYAKAIPVLEQLEQEADYPQNKTYAQANLMKAYYDKKDYLNAVQYAEKVINNPKTDTKIKSDAQIIIARAAIQVADDNKAKEAYAKLSKMAKGELAAEALYYEAYFKNKESKWELSNLTIQKLSKDYSGYKYFGAKALVVMAKNFYALKDSFQATYILESVIKNFQQYNDVVTQAQTELDKIKTEEAKTNASILK